MWLECNTKNPPMAKAMRGFLYVGFCPCNICLRLPVLDYFDATRDAFFFEVPWAGNPIIGRVTF